MSLGIVLHTGLKTVKTSVKAAMSVDLVFHNVSVTAKDKTLLHDVYGAVLPGQIMAIMGPSGAGKTTLMNCLSGRQVLNAGTITINGQILDRQLRRKICYVLQQDAFFSNLTLMETLTFTAMMRLPDEMSRETKMEKLESLIDALDLWKCVNTVMGDMWMPGLSGGETKRASIACELITDPTIILLDEPTSGLDYKTAFSLIQTLKNYARRYEKVVVTTLHQPSSQMFLSFDLLLLICEGHSIYYGSPCDVGQFFSLAGQPISPHYNPADFILERTKGSNAEKEVLIQASYDTRQIDQMNQSIEKESVLGENSNSDSQNVVRRWNKLPWKHTQNVDKSTFSGSEDAQVILIGQDNTISSNVENQKWPTGFLTQYKYLTVRAFKQAKSRLVDKSKIFDTTFLCILLSLIWFQLPRSEDTLRDRMGLIYYISMHWGFTPLFDAVTTFPAEKTVLHKERSSGWYRISAYYLAKMTSELPIIIIPPLLFISVVYWVTGLNASITFLATLGTILIHSCIGQSIGLCIGIVTMDMRRGISLSTVCIMFMMLIGGFFTRNLPPWLDWAKYLAFLYYTFHCLMILEFSGGKHLQCSDITNTTRSSFPSCLSNNYTMVSTQDHISPTIPSAEVLEYYGIDQPFWFYFLPLLGFLVFFRVLGYLILRFYLKHK